MPYQIDFLAVGEESKSGDAIALRYGDPAAGPDTQTIVVVDGGFSDDGARLVDHIRSHYETDRVDVVISTHPDADHINGLATVLEKLRVGELWMHLPWKHSPAIAAAKQHLFSRGRFSEYMTRSLTTATELEQLAVSKGIPIREPFTGVATADNCVVVVGPSEEFYEEMLADIERGTTVASAISGIASTVRARVTETWSHERLSDHGETTPSNNSSVVTLLNVDRPYVLLTGDAGIPALEQVADVVERLGIAHDFRLVQVPHHGSRRNVGPSVLDRILGPKRQEDDTFASGIVSAAKEGAPKHPAKVVANAFRRRGFRVTATAGRDLLYAHEYDRIGWTPVEPLPFFTHVEEDA